MSLKEFNCPKCGKRGFPILIKHDIKKLNYIIKLKCPKHKTILEIQENKINEYLPELVKSTLTCQKCGALDFNIFNIYNSIGCNLVTQEAFITILNGCIPCRKIYHCKIDYIFKSYYFKTYFEILKKQAKNNSSYEYKNILICPKCQNNIILKEVFEGKDIIIHAKCNGPAHHSVKLDLPKNQVYEWLDPLIETMYRCEKCNSTDIFVGGLKYQQFGRGPVLDNGIFILICKGCGYNNKIKMIMFIHFYEILCRICREKEEKNIINLSTFPSTEKELFCTICNSVASIKKLILENQNLYAILFCKQEHKEKKNLLLDEKFLWIDSILSGLKKCDHCWSSNYRIVKIFPKMPFNTDESKETEIKLQCLNCKRNREAIIDNLFVDEIMEHLFKQQAEN